MRVFSRGRFSFAARNARVFKRAVFNLAAYIDNNNALHAFGLLCNEVELKKAVSTSGYKYHKCVIRLVSNYKCNIAYNITTITIYKAKTVSISAGIIA